MGYAGVIGFVTLSMFIILCVICISGLAAKVCGQYAGFGVFVVLLTLALYAIYRLGKRIVLTYIKSRCVDAAS